MFELYTIISCLYVLNAVCYISMFFLKKHEFLYIIIALLYLSVSTLYFIHEKKQDTNLN